MKLPDPELQPEFYAYMPLKRAIAMLLDVVAAGVMWFPVVVILKVFIDIWIDGFRYTNPFMFYTLALTFLGYRTAMLARYGATIGMMVMVLKWRKLDGETPDLTMAFRNSLLHLGQYVVLPVQFISFVMIVATPHRQGLNDMLTETTMLHRSAPE